LSHQNAIKIGWAINFFIDEARGGGNSPGNRFP